MKRDSKADRMTAEYLLRNVEQTDLQPSEPAPDRVSIVEAVASFALLTLILVIWVVI